MNFIFKTDKFEVKVKDLCPYCEKRYRCLSLESMFKCCNLYSSYKSAIYNHPYFQKAVVEYINSREGLYEEMDCCVMDEKTYLRSQMQMTYTEKLYFIRMFNLFINEKVNECRRSAIDEYKK